MTKMGKKLAAVFLAVAMAITFIPVLGMQTVYAADDTAPPEIDPNSVTVDILDTDRTIAEPGDTVRISMTINDESVISGHYLYLYKPQTGQLSNIVSGVQLEGTDTWNFDFIVTDATEMGIWKIYSIRVEDRIGNYVWYYNENLHNTPNPQLIERFVDLSPADFEVSNTHPDLEAPVIDLTTLTVDPVNAAPGDTVKISVKVTDESAITSVSIWIQQPNGHELTWQEMTYNSETKKYERTIAITDETLNGQWQANRIVARDELGLEREEAAEYGDDFSGSIFTVSGAGGETNLPEIDESSIRVRLPAGSAYPNSTQVAYAKVSDDTSVKEVTFCYVTPITGQKKYFDGQYDGATDEWQASVFLNGSAELGAWKLLFVRARDQYYNTTTIYNNEISEEINAADLSAADFEVIASIADAVIASMEDVTYTGDELTPEPEVTMTIEGVETPLIKGTDYRFIYYDNINVGTATVSVIGKGTYGGWVHGYFTIKPRDLQGVTFSEIPARTYTGKKIEPTFTPTYNGRELVKGIDYTVNYDNNINVGTASVTITGKGNFTGKVEKTFKINKAANPLTIKPRTVTVKYSKLKKKAQTLAATKVINYTKDAKDKKAYTLSSVKKGKKDFKKYFKIDKSTGKVTIKKGLKKGTYKGKVKIKALGNDNYKASAVKTVTFTIKIK